MVKSKAKKGGNLNLEQQLETGNTNNNPLKKNPLEDHDDKDVNQLNLELENSFSNKSKQGGEDLTNNNQNNDLLNINNNVDNNDNSLVNSASSVMKSGLNIVNNALTGFTGNKVKIGGATPLQSKLYTVLHNRAVNLKAQLEALQAEQQNVQKRTSAALNDANGLLKQFTQYRKMGGGKKTHKQRRKHHHKKSRGRKHHHKKSRGRKRRH